MKQTYKVPEVSCGHCKSSIEGALKPLDGVNDATVDIEGKVVEVDFDDTILGQEKVVEAIEGVGYRVAS